MKPYITPFFILEFIVLVCVRFVNVQFAQILVFTFVHILFEKCVDICEQLCYNDDGHKSNQQKNERRKSMTVGEKLRELRGNRSQTLVAKELGISRTALFMYENDKRLPTPSIMSKIAKYYKKSVGAIFF